MEMEIIMTTNVLTTPGIAVMIIVIILLSDLFRLKSRKTRRARKQRRSLRGPSSFVKNEMQPTQTTIKSKMFQLDAQNSFLGCAYIFTRSSSKKIALKACSSMRQKSSCLSPAGSISFSTTFVMKLSTIKIATPTCTRAL
eukprot:7377430-Prymnesium_polylepis.1